MSRKSLLSLAVVAAFAGIVFGLRRCAPPPPPPPADYSRPGDDGGVRPPAVDRDIVTRVSNRGNPYTEDTHTGLNCDVVYKIGVIAREPAECEEYRFANLIGRASVPIALRINELTCPAGCLEKVSRFVWVKTECRNNHATAEVKAEVMCRAPGGPAWPGINVASVTVTVSTTAAAPGETGGFDPTERRSEFGEDLSLGTGGTWVLNCPQAVTFAYRYEEFDRAGCATMNNYEPVVERAVARLKTQYDAGFVCMGGCAKRPLAILRKEWSCDNATNNVVVKVWARVECR